MKEAFLYYVWRYQKFSTTPLLTVDQKRVDVLKPGNRNRQEGPDFFDAQLHYDGLLWNGPVEMHLKSSDWYRHGHHLDENYQNVILHIVWEYDVDIMYASGKKIPTLQVKDYLDPKTLAHYKEVFRVLPKKLPCEKGIHRFPNFQWVQWLERLFVERMEDRIATIQKILKDLKNDWEACLFLLLFKAYGLNINGSAFYENARTIPFGVVQKLAGKALDMEALFMGQSGLLKPPAVDAYQKGLMERYSYLKNKFNLSNVSISKLQFSRLRPSNFPSIRLAQLSALYAQESQLFQDVVGCSSPEASFRLFSTAPSTYWKTHYTFGSKSSAREKKVSRSFFDLILINTLLPLRFAYHRYLGKAGEDELFQWANKIPKEENHITRIFRSFGVPNAHAGQSQGLLQLFKFYCQNRACLQCNVGFQLMKT